MQRIWLSSVLAIVFSACTPSLQPIADIEGLATSAKLQLDIGTFQNPFSGKFTLYEAVACALKYNLDHRVSGCQSLEPSTATDKTYGTSDLKVTWNVLDFGLSKIRNEQLADETLLHEERRLKAIIRERLNKLMSEARRDLLQAELKQAAAQVYASIGSDPYGADLKAMRMWRLSRLVFERIGKPESYTQMMTLKYQLKLPPAFFGTNMIIKLKE